MSNEEKINELVKCIEYLQIQRRNLSCKIDEYKIEFERIDSMINTMFDIYLSYRN